MGGCFGSGRTEETEGFGGEPDAFGAMSPGGLLEQRDELGGGEQGWPFDSSGGEGVRFQKSIMILDKLLIEKVLKALNFVDSFKDKLRL